jgi:DNA-binding transcriptional MerR regulator
VVDVTLTQAAKALRVPQHRLIHLCEEQVVIPDVAQARGRGSSRRFSRRNLFEFAVALELRRLELPVSLVRAILRAIRTFEEATRRQVPGFSLPESIVRESDLDVSVVIVDGDTLYFALGGPKGRHRLVGGVRIEKTAKRSRPTRLDADEARRVLEEAKTRTELDLAAIARSIPWPVD